MEGGTNPGLGSVESAEGPAAPSISAFQSLVGVFANPRKTFEAMAAKPRFLLPMVLVLLAHAAFVAVIVQSGVVRNDTLAKLEAQGKAPEVVEAMEKFFDSPAAMVIVPTTAVVVIAFVMLLYAALVFFLGNLMLGGRLTYKQYLSVVAHSTVLGLVGNAVRASLAVAKGTMDIRLGAGNLLGEDPSFLVRFVDSITNPLALWPAAVMALGVSVLAKKSFSFGVMAVLPAFLLISLIFGPG
jgi:hypothetical protein